VPEPGTGGLSFAIAAAAALRTRRRRQSRRAIWPIL
jgi:hypothetical protein